MGLLLHRKAVVYTRNVARLPSYLLFDNRDVVCDVKVTLARLVDLSLLLLKRRPVEGLLGPLVLEVALVHHVAKFELQISVLCSQVVVPGSETCVLILKLPVLVICHLQLPLEVRGIVRVAIQLDLEVSLLLPQLFVLLAELLDLACVDLSQASE